MKKIVIAVSALLVTALLLIISSTNRVNALLTGQHAPTTVSDYQESGKPARDLNDPKEVVLHFFDLMFEAHNVIDPLNPISEESYEKLKAAREMVRRVPTDFPCYAGCPPDPNVTALVITDDYRCDYREEEVKLRYNLARPYSALQYKNYKILEVTKTREKGNEAVVEVKAKNAGREEIDTYLLLREKDEWKIIAKFPYAGLLPELQGYAGKEHCKSDN